MQPKVSVIMPVYNTERYLRQCLDSVLGQTLREIEVICVDDGSRDSSVQILQEYAARDPRVTVLQQANAGAGAARNKGLAAAAGEYLSVLDSDDFSEPDMLETAYLRAKRFDADLVVFGSDEYLEAEARFVPVNWAINKRLLPAADCFAARDIPQNIFRTMIGWTWDKLYKRAYIEELGLRFQEIRLHNDLLFGYGALASARRITVEERVLTHQRKRGGGSLSDERTDWWCVYDALSALEQYLKDRGLYPRFQRDFVNYVVALLAYTLSRTGPKQFAEVYTAIREKWFPALGARDLPGDYFYNAAEAAFYAQVTGNPAEGYQELHRREEARRAKAASAGRLGRLLAVLPRKARSALRCCREYGFADTVRYAGQSLRSHFKK